MPFDSVEFLFFFCAIFALYMAVGLQGFRKALLLFGSYVFYISWNPGFSLLLVYSTLMSFVLARVISGAGASVRRYILAFAIALALLPLFYFKYWEFISANLNVLIPAGRFKLPHTGVLLPVGISFFTFNVLGYLIDCFRGKVKPERNLLDYGLYVAFFPYLVAGPIVRAYEFLPQLKAKREFNPQFLWSGMALVLMGLFKKLVLSDNLSVYVNRFYSGPGGFSGAELLLGAYAFTVQIYCDFSGYTDMARGLAYLLGYELPVNFNLPYLAKNPREFWQRWHISLSSWLRDYVYIPLGGSRRGPARTYTNLFAVMLICGLWHGASWHFIAWGAYYGVLLVLYRMYRKAKPVPARAASGLAQKSKDFLSVLLMFHLSVAGWIIFKADTLGGALLYLKGILFRTDLGSISLLFKASYLPLAAILLIFGLYNLLNLRVNLKEAVLRQRFNPYISTAFLFLVIAMAVFKVDEKIQFIYFRF